MFRSMVHTVQTEVMTGRFANCDVSVCFIEATGAAGNQSRACRKNRQLGSWGAGEVVVVVVVEAEMKTTPTLKMILNLFPLHLSFTVLIMFLSLTAQRVCHCSAL